MSLEKALSGTKFRSLELWQDDPDNAHPAVGGIVIRMIADDALLVGDAVYLSSAGKAQKSTTQADYQARVGIVVGGQQTQYQQRLASTDIGVSAASADGEHVLVMIFGVCYGVASATLATIGTRVTGATTVAGRVGSTGAAAGNYVAYTLTAAANIGDAVKLLVGVPT
jgi:ribosomal protein L21E